MKRAILFFMLMSLGFTYIASAADMTYEPFGNTEEFISNIYFNDLYDISYLAPAQDCVALGLMFSDGKDFNPKKYIRNEDIFRIVYRAVGRETEGLAAAYNPEMREMAGLGEYKADSWSDGFYMMALADGLIDNAEFVSAFTDETSPISKYAAATTDNFIRFLCIANGIKTSGTIEGYGIGSYYVQFYAAMYHNRILLENDIKLIRKEEYLTNEIAAYILKKMESRILEKIGITRINGRVSSVEEVISEEWKKRTVTVFSNNSEYKLKSSVPADGAYAGVKNEYPVLGQGNTELSGCIREGDSVYVYLKDGKILFVRDETKKSSPEYTGAPVILRGTMYVHDYKKNELVLDNVKKIGTKDKDIYGYVKCWLTPETKFYYGGEEIDKYTLNTDFLDRQCTVFKMPSCSGGLERVYSVVFE